MKKPWVLLQGHSMSGMMIAATLLLPVAANKAYASVQDTPVSLNSSSWNADVVYGAASFATDSAVAFDGQYAWDALGSRPSGDEVTAGLPEYQDPNTGVRYATLPTLFNSVYINTITGTATQFEFQPFENTNNVNLFNNGAAGATLSLTDATALDNIAILAASANSGTHYITVNMTLHFANGSESSPILYNVYDWSKFSGGNAALPHSVSRSSADSNGMLETQSKLDTSNPADFQMYETDFNLQSLGYSNNAITSISFSAVTGGDVGIFALSGYANPDPQVPVLPDPPATAVPTPASLPLSFAGGTLLALAAMGRRFARNRKQMLR